MIWPANFSGTSSLNPSEDIPDLRTSLFSLYLCRGWARIITECLERTQPFLSALKSSLLVELLDCLPESQYGVGGRGEPELSSVGHVPLLLHQVQAERPAVALTGLQGGPPADGVGEARDSLETLVSGGDYEVNIGEVQRNRSEAGHGVHEVES